MFLSCTTSKKLSIISENFKRSRNRDHSHLRLFVNPKANTSHGQPVCKVWSRLKFKMGDVTWSRPFQGQFVICRLGFAMINLYIKFEVYVHPLRRYEKQRKM